MSPTTIDLERRFLRCERGRPTLEGHTRMQVMAMAKADKGWDELLEPAAVAILGEAGSGKSEELRSCCNRLRARGQDAFLLNLVDLAECRLDEVIDPEQADQFEQWLSGEANAHFFLDAVDEMRLRHVSLRRALGRLRAGVSNARQRVKLVVTCRGSDWDPTRDEADLRAFSGEDPKVFELAPLDAARVARLAEHRGVQDVDEFMGAVAEAGAEVFLGRPQDVLFLAQYWGENEHRLGTLTEIIEFDVKRKLADDRRRASKLDYSRARGGVETLAAALALAAERDLRVTQDGNRPGIRVSDALPTWSDADQAQLCRLGVFDEGTYGRVRLHHRTAQDYLAARWFWNQLSTAGSERGIVELLVPSVAGERLVPQHLEGVVAWVCRWHGEIRRLVIEAAPEVLLAEGDPDALDRQERCSVLRGFAKRFGSGERWVPAPSDASLRRFGCPELAGIANELLASASVADDLKHTLLVMVASARLVGCADIALQIACDENTHWHVRTEAIAAVAATREEAALGVMQKMGTPCGWDAVILAAVVEHFAGGLTVTWLLDALGATRPSDSSGIGYLEATLSRPLRTSWSLEQRLEFLSALLDKVKGDRAEPSSWEPSSSSLYVSALMEVLAMDSQDVIQTH